MGNQTSLKQGKHPSIPIVLLEEPTGLSYRWLQNKLYSRGALDPFSCILSLKNYQTFCFPVQKLFGGKGPDTPFIFLIPGVMPGTFNL